MKLKSFRPIPLLAVAFSWLIATSAGAQCQYTLEMFDAYGDGWNGGKLTITSAGVPVTFTLDNVNDDGIDSTLTFNVSSGAPLVFSYATGNYPWEVSFKIYDNTGDLFYEVDQPATGVLFNGVGNCVTCGAPKNFAVENVWDNRAKLRWQPNAASPNPAVNWRIIYGLKGFNPDNGEGDTLDVTVPKATLTGLQKKTWYEAYLIQDCGVVAGLADRVGPIEFQTYWTNDIGVTEVLAPLGGCDMGYDSVKVRLKNFGAGPQSLFKFSYAVNGTPAPVVPPTDGFFTGILGKDSSVVIAFETLNDFSASGEYRIDVYTLLAGDEDTQNDTFTYYVTNRLHTNYFQDFEAWNGGWHPGGDNPSWEFGEPGKVNIPAAASGKNAWLTGLTKSFNIAENSYLESPCFDFTSLTADPAISFALNTALIGSYDGLWLEMSTDGGQNWNKVGEMGEGLNWYNDDNSIFNLGEVWSGYTNGWLNARHSLKGSAGKPEVRLRFTFSANPFTGLDGVGIDDIRIFNTFGKDLAATELHTEGDDAECGLEEDKVIFSFVNLGYQNANLIQVAYSINGGTPVINNIGGSMTTDQNRTYTFVAPFDSRDADVTIKAWTQLPGDQNNHNDTVTYHINHYPYPTPYHENFEGLTDVPEHWTFDPSFGFSVTNSHNNLSNVLAFNMYSGNTAFTADLPRLSPIHEGDSLRFSYRITNYDSQGQTPTVLQNGTKFEVQVSTDCGANYTTINTINAFNHSPSVNLKTRTLSLKAYAGQFVKIRFKGTWGASDFWFDLDNINVLSCPADMGLSAVLTPASPGMSDGSATINVAQGNPPYTYTWSNGDTGQTAKDLAAGAYTVTVHDVFGCSGVLELTLGTSAIPETEEFAGIALYPNPANQSVVLELSFAQSQSSQLELLNQTGAVVRSLELPEATKVRQVLELTDLPSGIYLLRLQSEGRSLSRKLLVTH